MQKQSKIIEAERTQQEVTEVNAETQATGDVMTTPKAWATL